MNAEGRPVRGYPKGKPGRIASPGLEKVRAEARRARELVKRGQELGFRGVKLKTTLADPNVERLEAIRDEKLDAGKIWAVSGYATDGEARQALQLGATDFINKPLDLKYLEWSMQLYRATS